MIEEQEQKRNDSESQIPLMEPSIESANSKSVAPKAGYRVYYVVDVPFKYNGRTLKRGEEFRPNGGKGDTLLLSGNGKFVRRVEEAMPKRRGRR